jgi:hypothetical protein
MNINNNLQLPLQSTIVFGYSPSNCSEEDNSPSQTNANYLSNRSVNENYDSFKMSNKKNTKDSFSKNEKKNNKKNKKTTVYKDSPRQSFINASPNSKDDFKQNVDENKFVVVSEDTPKVNKLASSDVLTNSLQLVSENSFLTLAAPPPNSLSLIEEHQPPVIFPEFNGFSEGTVKVKNEFSEKKFKEKNKSEVKRKKRSEIVEPSQKLNNFLESNIEDPLQTSRSVLKRPKSVHTKNIYNLSSQSTEGCSSLTCEEELLNLSSTPLSTINVSTLRSGDSLNTPLPSTSNFLRLSSESSPSYNVVRTTDDFSTIGKLPSILQHKLNSLQSVPIISSSTSPKMSTPFSINKFGGGAAEASDEFLEKKCREITLNENVFEPNVSRSLHLNEYSNLSTDCSTKSVNLAESVDSSLNPNLNLPLQASVNWSSPTIRSDESLNSSTFSSNETINIDRLLEREKQHNKTENWNKLDKTAKIEKLHVYSEKYGKENNLSEKEIKQLKKFFNESLDKSKLQKSKDVVYNKETREIVSIPSLYLNSNTHNFSFKITDVKRVSTIKSLTPKRIQVIQGEELTNM